MKCVPWHSIGASARVGTLARGVPGDQPGISGGSGGSSPPMASVLVRAGGAQEVAGLLALDGVDHRLEDPLAGRVLEADRDQHELALAVLLALVAEPDRGGLPAPLQLV